MTANTLKACCEHPFDWHLMIRPDREEAPCICSFVAFEVRHLALSLATGITCEYFDGEVKSQVSQNELVFQ